MRPGVEEGDAAGKGASGGAGTRLKASSISAAVRPLRSRNERLVAVGDSRTCAPSDDQGSSGAAHAQLTFSCRENHLGVREEGDGVLNLVLAQRGCLRRRIR